MSAPRMSAGLVLYALLAAARPGLAQTTETPPISGAPEGAPEGASNGRAEAPRGEEEKAPATSKRLLGDRVRFLAGPRAGGLVPFSRAELTYDLGVELGAQLAWQDRLGLVVELGYRRPTRTVASSDLRLPAGAYEAHIADAELSLFVGPRLMFEVNDLVVPFGAIGLGGHFIRSTVEGTSGAEPFGETTEQSTQWGLGLRGGVGLHLGPGLATATLALDLAPLDHFTTGDTRTSGLSLALAYLFAF